MTCLMLALNNCQFGLLTEAAAGASSISSVQEQGNAELHAPVQVAVKSKSFADSVREYTRVPYRTDQRIAIREARKPYSANPKLSHFKWPSNANNIDEQMLMTYHKIRENGLKPDFSILLGALKICSSLRNLQTGKLVHADVICSRYDSSIVVATTLVHMYTKCGSRLDAHLVFNGMQHHDSISWNAMIFGYAEGMDGEAALQFFVLMQDEGFAPSSRSYVAALKACASCAAIEQGKCVGEKFMKVKYLEKGIAIHSQVAKSGYELDIFVASTLVDVYAKCGSMVRACQIFERMHCHSEVTWNAMIFGYIENGDGERALQIFMLMQDKAFKPGVLTYIAALKACSSSKIENGKLVKTEHLEMVISVHSQLAKYGYELNISVASTLIDIYARCGSMTHARWVFDKMPHHDLVSWTAMIFGYAGNGESRLAMELFAQMQGSGFTPDAQTYVAVLKACATCAANADGNQVEGRAVKMECLQKGRAIDSELTRNGHETDIFVASTLVDMYAKCGDMVHAHEVFDRMPYHDVVSWSALIFGYADSGEGELALQLFASMQDDGLIPDSSTYVAVLKACVNLAALETGKKIYEQICYAGLESDPFVASSLIGFYAKCGSMVDAQHIFDSLSTRDFVSWNALIAGYAYHGDAKRVFDLIKAMEMEGFVADGITCLSVLTACVHAGLIDKTKEYFHAMCWCSMIIVLTIEHYACIVDLFSRSNHLDSALTVVKNMPFEPDLPIWTMILGASQKWKNLTVGKAVFESMGDKDASAHLIMANIYAASDGKYWSHEEKC